jgi:hypothetical protein
MLKNVNYSYETSRNQRFIEDFKLFKANEIRNMLFYLPPLFETVIPNEYFEHFMSYSAFIRLLCQDCVSSADILLADDLIHDFVSKFENFYTSDGLTYNLHAHLHLTKQVASYGPLNKSSGFAFENMFRIARNYTHGTRGLVNQIARNTILDSTLHQSINKWIDEIENLDFKMFLKKINSAKALSVKENQKSSYLMNTIDNDHLTNNLFLHGITEDSMIIEKCSFIFDQKSKIILSYTVDQFY